MVSRAHPRKRNTLRGTPFLNRKLKPHSPFQILEITPNLDNPCSNLLPEISDLILVKSCGSGGKLWISKTLQKKHKFPEFVRCS